MRESAPIVAALHAVARALGNRRVTKRVGQFLCALHGNGHTVVPLTPTDADMERVARAMNRYVRWDAEYAPDFKPRWYIGDRFVPDPENDGGSIIVETHPYSRGMEWVDRRIGTLNARSAWSAVVGTTSTEE